MRITVNGIWSLTKWLIVIIIAYESYRLLRVVDPDEFVPGNAGLSSFDYSDVNPDYAMNITLLNKFPIQVDSIIVKPDGTPEYFFYDKTWCIRIRMKNGTYTYVKATDVLTIFYVKKGTKPG